MLGSRTAKALMISCAMILIAPGVSAALGSPSLLDTTVVDIESVFTQIIAWVEGLVPQPAAQTAAAGAAETATQSDAADFTQQDQPQDLQVETVYQAFAAVPAQNSQSADAAPQQVQPIIETSPFSGSGITPQQLNDFLAGVTKSISLISDANSKSAAKTQAQIDALQNEIALTNRINNLSGVSISNASITNSSGVSSGATALTGLSDVSLASPAFGDVLEYNGSAWVNVATSSLGLGGGSSYTFSYPLLNTANTISLAFGTTTANTWTGTQNFSAGASTTNLSIFNDAYFGGTATSSFNSRGQLNLADQGTNGTTLVTFGGQPFISATSSLSGTLAVGYQAGAALLATSSSIQAGNTAFGYEALNIATSSIANTAIGYEALLSLDDYAAQSNTAVGWAAGASLTTGQHNTITGASALDSATTGSGNDAFGYLAAQKDTTGSDNMAIGSAALFGNTTGSSNIAIGEEAANGNYTSYSGAGNVAIGTDAGYAFQTGADYNTLLGNAAGVDITTGADNTILGPTFSSGNGITTGSNNILIGEDIQPKNITGLSQSGSNQLDIGNLIFGTGLGYGSMLSSGDVGIGTSSPAVRLTVWGTDSASSTPSLSVVNNSSTTVFSVFNGGNAELSGSLSQNSDQRLKTNIQSLDASSSLAAIDALNPVTFNWIDPERGTQTQIGFIAQQILPIFPNLVATTSATALTPDGTLSLNYIGLISPIVSAVQELSQKISAIENTIAGFADQFTTKQLTFVRAEGTELDVQTANVQTLCVGATCVTESQLKALLAGAGQAASLPVLQTASSTDSQASATDTPPQIQINGNNPATVQVGATYNDLGATIIGPTADLNLGIQTFVNGVPMNLVQIDTMQAATDTIDYVVTDQNGLAATSTRSVIVEASGQSQVPAADATTTQ